MVKREMKLRTVLNTTFDFFESYWASKKSACTDYTFAAGNHWEIECYSLNDQWELVRKYSLVLTCFFFFFFMPYWLIYKTNIRNLLQVSRVKYIIVVIPEILIIVSTFIWNRLKLSSIKNSPISVISSSIFCRHQCLIFRHKHKLH